MSGVNKLLLHICESREHNFQIQHRIHFTIWTFRCRYGRYAVYIVVESIFHFFLPSFSFVVHKICTQCSWKMQFRAHLRRSWHAMRKFRNGGQQSAAERRCRCNICKSYVQNELNRFSWHSIVGRKTSASVSSIHITKRKSFDQLICPGINGAYKWIRRRQCNPVRWTTTTKQDVRGEFRHVRFVCKSIFKRKRRTKNCFVHFGVERAFRLSSSVSPLPSRFSYLAHSVGSVHTSLAIIASSRTAVVNTKLVTYFFV